MATTKACPKPALTIAPRASARGPFAAAVASFSNPLPVFGATFGKRWRVGRGRVGVHMPKVWGGLTLRHNSIHVLRTDSLELDFNAFRSGERG